MSSKWLEILSRSLVLYLKFPLWLRLFFHLSPNLFSLARCAFGFSAEAQEGLSEKREKRLCLSVPLSQWVQHFIHASVYWHFVFFFFHLITIIIALHVSPTWGWYVLLTPMTDWLTDWSPSDATYRPDSCLSHGALALDIELSVSRRTERRRRRNSTSQPDD